LPLQLVPLKGMSNNVCCWHGPWHGSSSQDYDEWHTKTTIRQKLNVL